MRFVFALLTIALLSLILARPATPVPAANTAAPIVHGDVDCSGAANAIDSLQLLLAQAGLNASTNCLDQLGDVNCDHSVNVFDSLRILGHAAGNGKTLDGCSPRGIAQRLYEAGDSAETDALLLAEVYPVLSVGVYSGDGKQILDGAETDIDNDFFLYEFESELISGGIFERQLYDLNMVTIFLADAGFITTAIAQPMTEAQLLAVLKTNVTAARAGESNFTWRLIDELGLAHADPLDFTAAGLVPETTYLDSLQVFLILNAMTSNLPDTSDQSSADVTVAAGGPSKKTKAKHNAMITLAYKSSIGAGCALFEFCPLPEPTFWKLDKDSTDEDRDVNAMVSFRPGPNLVQTISKGPLKNRALPPTGRLAGAAVDWALDSELTKNGKMKETGTRNTDANGEVRNAFVPNTECPTDMGTGTDLGILEGFIKVPIKSAFDSNQILGVIDLQPKNAKMLVTVSRRAAAQAVPPQTHGGTFFPSSADPLADLPCKWTGESHGTMQSLCCVVGQPIYAKEDGTMNATFTFGNPRHIGTNLVEYEIVKGEATWHSDGFWADCPYSKGGTENIVGKMTVVVNLGGSVIYRVYARLGDGWDAHSCYQGTLANGIVLISCGNYPLTGTSLSDSCVAGDTSYPIHWDISWQMTAGPCHAPLALDGPARPQAGTCGP